MPERSSGLAALTAAIKIRRIFAEPPASSSDFPAYRFRQNFSHRFHNFILNFLFAIAFLTANGVFYNGKYYYRKDVSGIMKKIIDVTGMHCTHCSKSVADALSAIDGVTKAKADHEKCIATVTMKTEVDDKILIETIEKLGFTPGEITIKEGIFG